jgi:SAM-dependent methyltransferase
VIIQIIFLVFLIFALFWFLSLLIAAYSGAPTIYSKDKIIKKALYAVNLNKNQKIVDFGCGNGRVLIIASRGFGARGVGVEISPFYYLLAKLNVLFSGESKNIKIYFGNIRDHEKLVNGADVVYLYLLDKIMRKIEPWIFNALKKNTKIISITFPFKNHKGQVYDGPPKIYIYN